MSETPERDWVPFLHIAVGCLLMLALGIARMIAWFDLGGGASMALLLFPTLGFVGGHAAHRLAGRGSPW